MVIKRISKLSVFVVDKLVDSNYHGDNNMAVFLRNTVVDPAHWHILGIYDEDKVVCVMLVQIDEPLAIIWFFNAENFFEWQGDDIQGQLDRYLKDYGCSEIRFFGRLGWLRKPPYGWKARLVEFAREI